MHVKQLFIQVSLISVSNLAELGTYAGNDCIVAFARLHEVNIVIHQLNAPLWQVWFIATSYLMLENP